jgi:hypothetical protein
MNYSLRQVPHASNGEKILCVGNGQPSGDLETWVPHPCAVCKGAVFGINEPDRFLGGGWPERQVRRSSGVPHTSGLRVGVFDLSVPRVYPPTGSIVTNPASPLA